MLSEAGCFSDLVRKSADVTKIDMAAVAVLNSDEYAICESLLEISSKIFNLDIFVPNLQKKIIL